MTFFDWFCNLSVLWYFKVGGIYINWYLAAILILYLLHPLFYFFASKCHVLGFIGTATIVMLLLREDIGIEDWHKMLIGRIPMYYIGCLFFFFQRKSKEINTVLFFCVMALFLFTFIFIAIFFNIKGYILQDMGAPFLIFGIFLLYRITSIYPHLQSYIELLGKYSYEIFIANALTYLLLYIWQIGFTSSYLIYIPLNIIFSYIFVFYGKMSNLILSKI